MPQVDDLREENQLLRRALHTLQLKAEAAGDPAAAAAAAAVLATSAGAQKRRPSHAADAAAHMSFSSGSPAGSSGLPPRPPAFAIAADGTSRPGSGSTGRPGSGARPAPLALPDSGDCSDDGSDSISLMSLNDGDDDSVVTGTATPTAASLAVSGLQGGARWQCCMWLLARLLSTFDARAAPSRHTECSTFTHQPPACVLSMQTQRNDAAMVVRSLERDLNKKQSLFDDDADFIREVRTGQTVSTWGWGNGTTEAVAVCDWQLAGGRHCFALPDGIHTGQLAVQGQRPTAWFSIRCHAALPAACRRPQGCTPKWSSSA